jgi:methylated-DNA-protein-cysteine methyltransferase related protein
MTQDDKQTGGEPSFPERVYAAVRTVPEGRLTTYGDVAAVVGNPRMARQVGWALSRLPEGTDVPWQRVINRHGTVSFRGELGRAQEQRSLLEAEGVDFDEQDRCDLNELRWYYPGARR